MNALPTLLACAAALLPLTACTAAPTPCAESALPSSPPASDETCSEPPNAQAPSVAELSRLFLDKAPQHAGKELRIRYRVVDERGKTGRRVGRACVNTREYDERLAAGQLSLGGGTLIVTFELETGRIISAGRAR